MHSSSESTAESTMNRQASAGAIPCHEDSSEESQSHSMAKPNNFHEMNQSQEALAEQKPEHDEIYECDVLKLHLIGSIQGKQDTPFMSRTHSDMLWLWMQRSSSAVFSDIHPG